MGGGPELTVLANVLRRPISIYELTTTANNNSSSSSTSTISMEEGTYQNIECKGTFGNDLFSDPSATIPNAAVLSEIQPGAYSWHLHILVLDMSETEKHACVLLPRKPTI